MRVRHLMRKSRGRISESDVEVAETAGDLVAAIDNKLTAASHARTAPIDQEVTDALMAAEIALRNILVRS
jgi:hypothetical protein